MQKILLILVSITSFTISSEFQAMDNACDNHIATACEELGYLYAEGEGVEKNRVKAEEYYTRACQYGFTQACNALDDLKPNIFLAERPLFQMKWFMNIIENFSENNSLDRFNKIIDIFEDYINFQ